MRDAICQPSPHAGAADAPTGGDGAHSVLDSIEYRSLRDLDIFWMSAANPGNLGDRSSARVGGGSRYERKVG
jgi:hypothetical protein